MISGERSAPVATDENDIRTGFLARLSDVVLQALPALLGTVGFIGFVAFVGGAISWMRFHTAGLPADQAVGVMPRAELVTIGAVSLTLFALVGLLAVIAVFLLDRKGNPSDPTRRGVVAIAVLEMAVALARTHGLSPQAYVLIGLWLLAVGLIGSIGVNRLGQRIDRRRHLKELRDALTEHRAAARAATDARAAWDSWRDAPQDDPPPDWRYPHTRAVAEAQEQDGADRHRRVLAARARAEQALENLRLLTERSEVPPACEGGDGDGSSERDLEQRAKRILAASVMTRLKQGVEKTLASRSVMTRLKRWTYELEASQAEKTRRKECEDETDARREDMTRSMPPRQSLRLVGRVLIVVVLVAGLTVVYGLAHEVLALALLLIFLPILGLYGGASLLAMVLLGAGLAILLSFDKTVWLAVMVPIVVVLAAALVGMARATARFAWYGVAVFLSISLFGGLLTAVEYLRTPEIQPVALIRKGDNRALCGVYVTETSDRLYLGHVELERTGNEPKEDHGRIYWVPSKDVDMLKLGTLQPIQHVEARAATLRAELYRDRAEEHPTPLAATTTVTRSGGKPTPEITETKASSGDRVQPKPKNRSGSPKRTCAQALTPPR